LNKLGDPVAFLFERKTPVSSKLNSIIFKSRLYGSAWRITQYRKRPRYARRAPLSSRSKLDFREVNVGLGDFVEVVGEDVERDVGDDFADLTVGKTGVPHRL